MARATYDCPSCGVKITVTERNRREADRRRDWYVEQGRVCDECRRAEYVAAHEAAVAVAVADPINATLPTLTGTDKQIAWATKLRLEALAAIDAFEVRARDVISHGTATAEERAEAQDAISAIAEQLRGEQSASVWIDARGMSIGYRFSMALIDRPTLCPTLGEDKTRSLARVLPRM